MGRLWIIRVGPSVITRVLRSERRSQESESEKGCDDGRRGQRNAAR